MPYHHKAPQHEHAQHASRIVDLERHAAARKRHGALGLGAQRRAALDCLRDTALYRRARPRHARAASPPAPARPRALTHISLLPTLDIINKIIVQHQLVH
ncbi:jg9482 [Pararge aegeria aegeria]|uniref:Jg9482 protein n=1 Tax=Pararge aegeria aegeria TaxID=348720 RepID=A0A8S4RK87_9NEOP|nr:jg9482 [Pararge aegeria aegeria]